MSFNSARFAQYVKDNPDFKAVLKKSVYIKARLQNIDADDFTLVRTQYDQRDKIEQFIPYIIGALFSLYFSSVEQSLKQHALHAAKILADDNKIQQDTIETVWKNEYFGHYISEFHKNSQNAGKRPPTPVYPALPAEFTITVAKPAGSPSLHHTPKPLAPSEPVIDNSPPAIVATGLTFHGVVQHLDRLISDNSGKLTILNATTKSDQIYAFKKSASNYEVSQQLGNGATYEKIITVAPDKHMNAVQFKLEKSKIYDASIFILATALEVAQANKTEQYTLSLHDFNVVQIDAFMQALETILAVPSHAILMQNNIILEINDLNVRAHLQATHKDLFDQYINKPGARLGM